MFAVAASRTSSSSLYSSSSTSLSSSSSWRWESVGVRGVHFWMRAEVKPNEARTFVLPRHVETLIGAGHQVTVEKSVDRCVESSLYEKTACTMAEPGSWKNAPADAVICGLKELPEDGEAISHRHIYFAHCFKQQDGSADLLNRFKKGGGQLWDLEFLEDETGNRVAAFGVSAGKNGMAMGLLVWAWQQANKEELSKQTAPSFRSFYETFKDFKELTAFVKGELDKVGRTPSILIIGPRGRSGRGATEFAQGLGIEPHLWGLSEKNDGIPLPAVADFDIFLNAIYIDPINPPETFLDFEMLKSPTRKLTVISDVSCDPNNPNNPIPVYDAITTLESPSRRILQDLELPLDVTAIDHLPSIVPEESSAEFTDALMPHLLEFDNSPVWHRAKDLYKKKLDEVLGQE